MIDIDLVTGCIWARLEMASSESDLDEFFDAKDSLMSPTLSQSEKDNTVVHRFVYLFN